MKLKTLSILGVILILFSAFNYKTTLNGDKLFKIVELSEYYAKKENKKGKLKGTVVETYNDKGLLIESKSTNIENGYTIREVFEYNSIGQKIKSTQYKSGETVHCHSTFSFNEDGMIKEELYYWQSEPDYDKKFIYNWTDSLTLKKEKYNSYGSKVSWEIIKEDEKGKVVSKTSYGRSGDIRKSKRYEYSNEDTEGNWLTKKYWKNDKIYSITERVITYK